MDLSTPLPKLMLYPSSKGLLTFDTVLMPRLNRTGSVHSNGGSR